MLAKRRVTRGRTTAESRGPAHCFVTGSDPQFTQLHGSVWHLAGGHVPGWSNALAGEAYSSETMPQMSHPENVVSIHPYFRVKPGKLSEAKLLLSQMVARTSTETANLYYDFTINGDVVFCREAYVEADGLLKHLDNVGPVLEEFLKIADILRVEVHGASASLEKLKGPLGNLNPEWFLFECGVVR